MAITTAQRNAGYRQLVLDTIAALPAHERLNVMGRLARTIILAVKNGANQTQREIGKVVGQEIWAAATGLNPVTSHQFSHDLHRLIEQTKPDIDDGVTTADTFTPENITVT